MRVQILGTGAAEGWPGLFCRCGTCQRARAAGGYNLRTRASLQVGDTHKIDLPPDTFCQAARFGLELSRLKHLFITHSHIDHFASHELELTRPPFAHDLADPPLVVYGNEAVVAATKWLQSEAHAAVLQVRRVEPFVPVSADGLVFTPVLAEHAPPEQALNYVVTSPAGSLLYASDTGRYGPQTMEYLAGFRLDLVIAECTQGTSAAPAQHHLGWAAVLQLRDDLARAGALCSGARVVITHFSHNIGLLHDELEALAAPEGITVAYDGIGLEV